MEQTVGIYLLFCYLILDHLHKLARGDIQCLCELKKSFKSGLSNTALYDWFRVKDIKLNGIYLSECGENEVLEVIFESYYD